MVPGPNGKPARAVVTGIDNGDQVEILSGLNVGDKALIHQTVYTPQQGPQTSPLTMGGKPWSFPKPGRSSAPVTTMPVIEMAGITRSYLVGGRLPFKSSKRSTSPSKRGNSWPSWAPPARANPHSMQILGLLTGRPTARITFMGQDVSRLTDDEGAALRSKTIGFIFQMFNLLARTSALDNVALPMIYSGAPNREAARQGSPDRCRSGRPHGPQAQPAFRRPAAARRHRPVPGQPSRNLFADEPTGNLASDQAEDILRQLSDLNRTGITVIMVTHEPDIAAHAKRVIHIKDGRIVSDEQKASEG